MVWKPKGCVCDDKEVRQSVGGIMENTKDGMREAEVVWTFWIWFAAQLITN